MTRAIGWHGAFNARDLGGLALVGGGTTQFGRVIRSGRVEPITSEGWQQAAEAGLRTILDLRNDGERRRLPSDPDLDQDAMHGITVVECPIEDQADVEFIRRCGDLLSQPDYYPDNMEMFPDLLGAVFSTIGSSPTPLLFHCSAGRDRTGLIACLLLRLNGVEPAVIVADYADGVRGYQQEFAERGLVDANASDEDEAARRIEFLDGWIADVDVATFLHERAKVPADLIAAASTVLRP